MSGCDGLFTEALDGTGVDREAAGDKAWALERLIEHGFPVPAAVLVRAPAYRAVVADAGLRRLLDDWRAAPSTADCDVAAIADAFLAAPLPPVVERAVRAAIATLFPGAPLVVRPSVTGRSTQRLAGRTVLGVGDVDQALEAVRRCWAALWLAAGAPPAVDGEVDDAPTMAVIVQRQVVADAGGTLFTRDPRGDGTTMRLVAERGAGNLPAVHQVQRHDLAAVAHREATPPFLEDLARLGLRIERRFGEPQEITWVVRAGSIWILNSFAITDRAPSDPDRFDTAVPSDDVFSPQGLAEMLPGVLDPLSWSINGALLEHGLRAVLRRNGAEVPPLARPLVGRFHGRAAMNLGALGSVLAGGAASGVVEREYFGTDAPIAADRRPRASIGGLLRAWRERRRVEDEVAVLTTAVGCLPLLEPDLPRLPSSAIIAYRRELRDLAERGVVAELAASTTATTAYHNLEALLQRWLGETAGTVEAQRITAGGLVGRSVGPRRVATLAAVVARHRSAGLEMPPAGTSVDEMRDRLREQGEGGRALVAEVEEAVRAFGSVAIYAGPTFDEDPEALWRLVAAAASVPREAAGPASPQTAVDRAIGAHASTRSWRTLRVLTGQLVDVRRRILYRLATDAVHYLALREEAKGALLALGGMERRAIVEAATRLTRSGHLDGPGDVGLLEDSELDQMLLGGEPVGRLTLDLRRASDAAARAGGPLPRSFVGSPDTVLPSRHDSAVLRGWAASPGVVTGRVRRLRSVAEGDDLEPGEIIVAVTTDPTWTPLFLRAGGVVLEQGGPLSHAAIVARELGLPAVLSVDGAMERLTPGSPITVDGTTGVILPAAAILEEVGS